MDAVGTTSDGGYSLDGDRWVSGVCVTRDGLGSAKGHPELRDKQKLTR